METRAPFAIVGAFILAAIVAGFGFVYWLHNSGGLGARTVYHVQFNGPVPGLLVGAAVLFNGIRVGEVTDLSLAEDDPRRVDTTIAVATTTPVRADTRVGLDFQGLTGVPVIALEGGTQRAASGPVPLLIADPAAGQSMTQAARDALRKVDTVLSDNAEALHRTIGNLDIFAGGLARNTGRLDGIVTGLERMTGGGPAPPPKVTYNLQTPQTFPGPRKTIKGQFVIPEPTTLVMFDTQRILLPPNGDFPGFAEAQWSDNIPKMLQAKFIQSFENYDMAHAPLRAMDGVEANHQLLIDIRNFQVVASPQPTAEIAFSAKILGKDGRVVAARLFEQSKVLDKPDMAAAMAAYNSVFDQTATELVTWTSDALSR